MNLKNLRKFAEDNLRNYEIRDIKSKIKNYVSCEYNENLFSIINDKGSPFVFIISGMHGWERDNPELILNFLKNNDNLKSFICYPVVHRGFAKNYYEMVETNNFWRPVPETRVLIEFFKEMNNKFDIEYVIDFHEHEEDFSIIYTSNYSDEKVKKLRGLKFDDLRNNGSTEYFSKEYGINSLLIEVPKYIGNKYGFIENILKEFL
jgi:hypothetical protein